MASNQLSWVLLISHALIFCSGEEVTVVIDTESDLDLTGTISEAFYVESANQIPEGYVPEEIRNSEGNGYWLFSSSDSTSLITLNFHDRVYQNFELRYYGTEKIQVYFHDLSMEAEEVLIPLPGSVNNQWSTFRLDVERTVVNEAPVTFRIKFPRGTEAPLAYFILDSISYNTDIVLVPTTKPPTTPIEVPTTTESLPGKLVTVIDTEDQLNGKIEEAFYVDFASEIPAEYFPEEIIGSDGVGFWLFSSSSSVEGSISLNFDTTFLDISLKYYNTEPIECYFRDWAQSDIEVKLMLPASQNNDWSVFPFEIARDVIYSSPVTFRLVFPRGTELPMAHFLLDSISYTSEEVISTTTVAPTSPEPSTVASSEPSTTPSETTTTDPIPEVSTTTEDVSTEATTPSKSSTVNSSFTILVNICIVAVLASFLKH